MAGEPIRRFIGAVKNSVAIAFFTRDARNNCLVATVPPEAVPLAAIALHVQGAVFDYAYAMPCGSRTKKLRLSYLFRLPACKSMMRIEAEGNRFHAVSSMLGAALWDERKMRDVLGVDFVGLPDPRPLVSHPESGVDDFHSAVVENFKPVLGATSKYATLPYPMLGSGAEGEFEIPVGPVHAGIIEPGHFRFHVLGETINRMEVRMFFLHRGVERLAEGMEFNGAIPLVEQVSGDESVANAVAYAQAVENLAGIRVPKRAESIRLILLELERIYSHLADLGGIPTDVGFYASASRFSMLREDMMRLNAAVTGSRFLRGMCVVGGVSRDLDVQTLGVLRDGLSRFSSELDSAVEITQSSSTFLDRVFSAGRLTQAAAESLAVVGPVARASGVSCDSRKYLPYGAYKGRQVFESLASNGDVLSRFNVKLNEVKASVHLVHGELKAMVPGPVAARGKFVAPEGTIGIGECEAPRGACTFVVESAGDGRIGRLCCRTASFRNWRAIERAVESNIVPDFPLINKSFNLSYAGTDL